MKKNHVLFYIAMGYNGFCLFVSMVVGLTFLIGSQMPSTASPDLPDIILIFFWIFDLLLKISPVMLVAMVILSIFNLMRESTNFYRWTPLVFSTIMQGALSALFLSFITQPVS